MNTLLGILVVVIFIDVIDGQLTWIQQSNGQSDWPAPRRDPGLGYHSNRNVLVLFGGRDADRNYLNDTWIYNINTGEWRNVLGKAPSARRSFVYGSSKGKFYIATGEQSVNNLNDIWEFDFATEAWRELPQKPCEANGNIPETRYGAAGGINPNSDHFYVSLGFGKVRYFDTFTYDVNKECWKQVTSGDNSVYNPMYPHARCLHGGAMTGPDQLVIFGGCLGGGGVAGPCPVGDTWLLQKDDNGMMYWSEMEVCPIPRIYTTMAMLPSPGNKRMAVLYGGVERTNTVLKTADIPDDEVAVFDAEAKTWSIRQTQEIASPPRRSSAALVTTTDGVYMFGGLASNGVHLNDMWELKGEVLDTPSSRSCNRPFFSMIIIHGILMFLSWGVFLQAGAFIARYCKGDKGNNSWFKVHIAFQIIGLLLAIGGLVFAVLSVEMFKGHFELAHGIIGLIVLILGCLQPANAVIRPHVKKGIKTTGRVLWEFVHKTSGRIALILALVNITLGLFVGVIPRPVWIAWLVYCGCILLMYVIAEVINCRKSHSGKGDFEKDTHL